MNVSQWLAAELVRRGVAHVFTLPGGYSQFINDAVAHTPGLIPVYMLHESGAAFAAKGYAQISGKMGVCVVTSGLAQTNALSGVACAYANYLPMMVISGDVKSELLIQQKAEPRYALHKIGADEQPRQVGQQDVPIEWLAREVTKRVDTACSAYEAMWLFCQLWAMALEHPCGPVWLDIPINISQEEVRE